MSSCDNSNIRKNYIVQGGNEFDIISACTGVYTNNLYNCTGDTITVQSTNLSANTINATVYLSGGTNLLDIFSGDSNTFVTGFTYDESNNLTISRSDNVSFGVNITEFSGITVNGVLSACTGIYTSNIYGCSPITVQDNLILNSGLTFNTISNNNTIDRLLVVSTGGTVEYRDVNSLMSGTTFVTGFTYDDSNNLTIIRNDGVNLSTNIDIMSGLTINGDLLVTGTTNISGLTSINNSLDVYNGTIGLRDNDYFLQGTSTGGTNVQLIGVFSNDEILIGNQGYVNRIMDNTIIKGELDILSGLTLSQTPTLNNSGTDILIRNSSTGEVEYRPVSGITPDTNTFTTGFTYDDVNTFTISRNDGVDLTSTISVLSGITYYGDGSNLSGITTTDTFVSGGTYNSGTNEINFVGNSSETTFDVDLSSLISSVSGDTFVVSGNADVATSQLTFTYNTGGTFTVTNSAALFSDNDINVTGGTYDNNTGCVTFTTNSGTTFDVCGFVTGLTDTFTTGSTLVGETIQFDSNILGLNYYNVSLSPVLSGKTDNSTFNSYTSNTETILNSKVSGATNLSTTGLFAQKNGEDLEFKGLTSTGGSVTITTNSTTVNLESVVPPATNTFVTGGTYNESTDIITLTRNDAVTIDITGVTDTFTTGATYDNGTTLATFTKNNGTTYTLDLSTIDVNDTFSTGGTVTQSATSGNSEVIVQIVGNDGFTPFNITGLTDTFVTGTTFDSNQAVLTRNDGVDVFKFSGGSNVTLSNPSSNQIKIDVSLPPSMNTFTTGFTYDDANTLTIERNDGVNLDTTINTVTALTVTNYIDYITTTKPTSISGRTYFDRVENALSYFPDTPANDVTINIGQESVIRVHNNTGVQINNGEVCHISSNLPSVNGVPSVVLAIATGSTTTGSRYLVSGVATHDIPNGTEGFITEFGLVRDLNVTGVTEGTEIYLSETTPGAFRYSAPDTEFRRSVIGYVVTTGTTTGKILVEITNEVGFSELSESLLSVVTENNASTGTRDGGEITINSGDNTLFDISSGSGIIVDNYTDPNNPTITNVVWNDITGNTVTNLTGDAASYIFLDSSLNTVQFGISNPPTEGDFRDNIFLGIVGHANFTNLINIFNIPIQIVSPINQHQDLTSAIGPFSINGNRVSNIVGTLKLQKSAGNSYFYGGNFHTDNKVPSNITTTQLSGSTLVYAKGTAVLGPTSSDIDPNNYDPDGAGTITAIPGSNNYVAHRIWHQPSANLLIFQYGQEFYANQATARDEFEFESFVTPPGLNETSYLVAVIISQDGDTDLDSAIIIPQGKFAGTGGGGGSAADTLQTAYDNSTPNPEILTDATRGSVDFRVGSGSDSDSVVTFQQNSGTINAFVEGTGNAKFETLSGDSLNILSLPTLNNIATDILVRNSSTGEVEYRPVSGITPDTNTFVTGGTYSDSTDIITLTRNDAVTIDITGITDTFVTGTTFSSNQAVLTTNDGVDVLKFSGGSNVTLSNPSTNQIKIDVSLPPSMNTFTTGFTYDDANTFTITRNDDVSLSSTINNVTGLTINGNLVVTGTTNISGTTTVDSTLQVDGNVNITSNSFFFQGTSVGSSNVSLIGVDSSDVIRIGNLGYNNYIEDDTTINGVLTADTIFLATLPTLNNSGTDLLVRNTTTGEIEYRPVSGITPDTNTFVTGGTYSDSTDIITLTRNDAVTIDITGVTDTFTTGSTYDNSTATATFTKNDGTSYTLDLSTIDVNDTFSTGGTVTQSSSNSENNQTIQIVGNDGFNSYNITGVTDTFTTGGTYNNGTALITFDKNDGTSYDVDLSTLDLNDTFVTGFTYNNANTFTLTRNDDVDITTSFNIVTGLTVNGDLTVTGETSLQSTTASTLTLSSTPTLNNSNTEILSRNSSTGVVEYKDVTTFGSVIKITRVTGTTYTASTIDEVIGVDTSVNTVTLYLPDSVTIGKIRYEVKDIGFNSRINPITITAAGSDIIYTTSSVKTFDLSADGGAVILVSTGDGEWWQM